MDKDRKSLLISIGIIVLLLALVAFLPGQSHERTGELNLTDLPENTTVNAVFIEDGREVASLQLEVADSEEEREKGLMYRRSLEEGTGMLFVWNSSKKRSFWMKNTYIPLDMIFISEERKVLNVEEADPEPNTLETNLKVYTSDAPAQYVIETRQGFSASHGIEEGTKVRFSVSR